MPTIETLGPLRHICHASGGCCQGNIAMLKKEEEVRVRIQAQHLQIQDPIQEGALKKSNGRCVFLNQEKLCSIHAQFGEREKPTVCKQFPFVAIHTEEEIRVGIDPGCLSAWKTWKNGPETQPSSLISTKHPISHMKRHREQELLDLLAKEDTSIIQALKAITGKPHIFIKRWREHISSIPLKEVLKRQGTAPIFQKHLCGIAQLTKKTSSTIDLSKEQEEWVLESTQRMLYLRFLSKDLTPHATALLVLGGAVASAWVDPNPISFGPTFAAWNRAIRSKVFLSTLLPRADTIAWLAGR